MMSSSSNIKALLSNGNWYKDVDIDCVLVSILGCDKSWTPTQVIDWLIALFKEWGAVCWTGNDLELYQVNVLMFSVNTTECRFSLDCHGFYLDYNKKYTLIIK